MAPLSPLATSMCDCDVVRQGSANSGRIAHLGRETFHSGLRNNLNLYFKFAILIGQNKCNHLVFYVISFIKFCPRKLLSSIVVSKSILSLSICHEITCSQNGPEN